MELLLDTREVGALEVVYSASFGKTDAKLPMEGLVCDSDFECNVDGIFKGASKGADTCDSCDIGSCFMKSDSSCKGVLPVEVFVKDVIGLFDDKCVESGG